MAKGSYRKGYELEKRARGYLEGMGYFVVESRGSHGPVDLVAIPLKPVSKAGFGFTRLVQVKSGSWISKEEREGLRSLAKKIASNWVMVELWCYPPWQTKPKIEEIS